MEESRLPLQKWLLAMYIMTTARKGISSVQFAKEIGVTQKNFWPPAPNQCWSWDITKLKGPVQWSKALRDPGHLQRYVAELDGGHGRYLCSIRWKLENAVASAAIPNTPSRNFMEHRIREACTTGLDSSR